MAKLKIGQLNLSPAPRVEKPIEVPVKEEMSGSEVMSIVEKAISMLPKPEVAKEVNLNPIMQRLQDLEKQVMVDMLAVDAALEDMKIQLDEVRHMESPALALPEVKQITHVKDVSAEVMEYVEAYKKELKGDLMIHANHIVTLESKNKLLSWCLVGSILLTIFLQLI